MAFGESLFQAANNYRRLQHKTSSIETQSVVNERMREERLAGRTQWNKMYIISLPEGEDTTPHHFLQAANWHGPDREESMTDERPTMSRPMNDESHTVLRRPEASKETSKGRPFSGRLRFRS